MPLQPIQTRYAGAGTLIVLSDDVARDQDFLAYFHESGWRIIFARKTAMQ
jgi:hypothetical protein